MGTSRKNISYFLENDFIAGYTLRNPGYSKSKFSGLNLAVHTNDNKDDVFNNRLSLAKSLNTKIENLIFANQTHSDTIRVIDNNFLQHIHKNINSKNYFIGAPNCDSMITNLKGIFLCILIADCSGIVIIDTLKMVIACVHSGRAGCVQKIFTKTVKEMVKKFNSNANNLYVFVSPNIKHECYDIGELKIKNMEKYCLDNKFDQNLAILDEAKQLGIKNIEFSDICTHCNNNFYSYRRDGQTGRFCIFAGIKN